MLLTKTEKQTEKKLGRKLKKNFLKKIQTSSQSAIKIITIPTALKAEQLCAYLEKCTVTFRIPHHGGIQWNRITGSNLYVSLNT